VAEAGVPSFEMIGYFGCSRRRARPPQWSERCTRGAARDQAARRGRAHRGRWRRADGCTPAELRALLERDMKAIAELTRGANIQR